jgi:hypothetical protein
VPVLSLSDLLQSVIIKRTPQGILWRRNTGSKLIHSQLSKHNFILTFLWGRITGVPFFAHLEG